MTGEMPWDAQRLHSNHRPVIYCTSTVWRLAASDPDGYQRGMGEHPDQRVTGRPRIARKRPGKQALETMGRRLLESVVYDKRCRIGGTLTMDDLAAVSQGWLIVEDDALTLTTAGLAAARTNGGLVGGRRRSTYATGTPNSAACASSRYHTEGELRAPSYSSTEENCLLKLRHP
jgi:hypothetical protein